MLLAVIALLIIAMTGQVAQAQVGISSAEARQAMETVLAQKGISPAPGLSYADYIKVQSGTNDVRVRIYMNDANAMVPTADWQKHRPEFCRSEARYPQQQTRFLQFKLIRSRESGIRNSRSVEFGDGDSLTRDQLYVFAKTGTIDSDGILNMHEAVETNDTRYWADEAGAPLLGQANVSETADTLAQGYNQLAGVPQAVAEPCADVRVKHVDGNQANKPAQFTAGYQGSSHPDLQYTWDFGDGSPLKTGGKNQQHTYVEAASYTVVVATKGGRLGPASGQTTAKIGGDCIVGQWLVDNQHAGALFQDAMKGMPGTVSTPTGTVVLGFDADGGLQMTYSAWTVEVKSRGMAVKLVRNGTDKGSYKAAADGSFTQNISSVGSVASMHSPVGVIAVPGEPARSQGTYQCEDDTLIFHINGYTGVLTRQ